MPKRKLISFDWAIKRILRSKANFEILEGFLSELLYEDIKIIEVLESESNQDSKDDKFNRLDLKVKNSKDEILIIEIQYNRELDFLQKMLYSSSKVISEHLKEGESYKNVAKVISINILYFNFGDGDDYIYKGTTKFKGIHKTTSELKLTKRQQEIFDCDHIYQIYPQYYIIKVQNFDDIAKDSLDEWIYFLKNEEIKDDFKAKGLKKAKENLDYIKMQDDERIEYEKWQRALRDGASAYESTYVNGHMDGKKEGLKEGVEVGKKQEKIDIAKKLLKAKVDLNTISISTELTIQEIESIQI
jgi:predicted transposase/invertase (TIGR01784 family)